MKIKPYNLKTALGIVLVLLAVAALLFWEAEGRQMLLMKEVLVADSDIKAGEEVTAGMFRAVSVPTGTLVDKAVTPGNAGMISGKIAAVNIIKGAPLSLRYIQDRDEKPKPPTSCFIIRNEWIYMCTSSLRRGDEVIVTSADGIEVLGRYPVAYVKDADGREVTNATSGMYSFTGSGAGDERVNTSAPIHHVEIECELKDYRRIVDFCSGKAGAPLMLIREIPQS